MPASLTAPHHPPAALHAHLHTANWIPLTLLLRRLFEFVMRMLATGQNCLPAAGIGAMAQQLAARLPADSIHTGITSMLFELAV
jgi:hypothetical protein